MLQEDLFQRNVFARELIAMVKALPSPYAFGLDAEWGSGKTFFIHNCLSKPSTDLDVPYIVYDAFEHEKDGDVLLSLIASIVEQAKGLSERLKEKSKFEEALTNVVKKTAKVISAVGSVVVQAGAKAVLKQNASDIADKFSMTENVTKSFGENIEKSVEHFLQTRLVAGKSYKTIKSEFQSSIKQLAFTLSSNSKLLIIIDELDRCTPTHALQVLEATNHILNTDGLIFMFSHHRSQLEGMIEHTYGVGIDAPAYLQKFIHFNLKFPKVSSREVMAANLQLAQREVEKYGDPKESPFSMRDMLSSLSNDPAVTPRLVQRFISMKIRIEDKADPSLMDRLGYEGISQLLIWKLTKPKDFIELIKLSTEPTRKDEIMKQFNYFYYFPKSQDTSREFFLTKLLLRDQVDNREAAYWYNKLSVFETL